MGSPDLSGRERPGKDLLYCSEDGSSITLKADPIERDALLAQGDPFYVPPYVGGRGWVGVRLGRSGADWEEVAELIATSYCLIAPKPLASQVTQPPSFEA